MFCNMKANSEERSSEGMSQKFGRLALHMWTIDTTPLATALDAAADYDAVDRRTDFAMLDAKVGFQVVGLIKSGILVECSGRIRLAIRHQR
jgi:hypothetical protein